MSKVFDLELFLAAVLTGSYATRQRHLRQAKLIQAEIAEPGSSFYIWSRFNLMASAVAVAQYGVRMHETFRFPKPL